MKLSVIADDLTGALDTGVKFSENGVSTFVICDYSDFETFKFSDYEVIVFDTNTRHSKPYKSRDKVSKIIELVYNCGTKFIYKKIDSTLRGNIGAELEAIVTSSNNQSLIFIPAYPQMGRTTENGIQYVNGIELSKSEFGEDILNPIKTGSVRDLIALQTDLNVINVSAQSLYEDTDFTDKSTIYVFDARSENDLINIANRLKASGLNYLFAGCAGFAKYMPALAGLSMNPNKFREIRSGKTLIVCGSVNRASINQIKAAIDIGIPNLLISSDEMIDEIKEDSIFEESISLLNMQDCLILNTAESIFDIKSGTANAENSINALSQIIVKNLGNKVKRILSETDISNLVIFGGDTLRGILFALNLSGITPERELFEGIPLSVISVCDRKINLITKAGGFGGKNILIDIIDYLNP